MDTLLKKRTGAPGDYISALETLPATFRTNVVTKPASRKQLGLTPAEFPGDEEERMTFIHQYPSSALEEDMDDDVDEDLDEDDIDDVDLDEEDGNDLEDVSDDDLDDDDLDIDIEDDEEDEDDVI